MATGGRDLERPATDPLAPHVGEIRLLAGTIRHGWDGSIGPTRLPAQHAGELGQGHRAMDRVPADERGFAYIAQRHHQAEGRGRVGQRDHARHVTQEPVEPELPTEREALRARGAQLTGGDEEPDGDGQIEPGATFAQARRRKVYDRPAERPGETAGQQGRPDPVTRLSH